MKKSLPVIFGFIVLVLCFTVDAQTRIEENNDPFSRLEIIIGLQRPPENRQISRSSQIKDIQVFGAKSGVAFTDDTLFRTDDNGARWRKINLPYNPGETISAAAFLNENIGFVLLADLQNVRLKIAKTQDGGSVWTKMPVNLYAEDLREVQMDRISLETGDGQNLKLSLRLQSSSNFDRRAVYLTNDGGQTWTLQERSDFPVTDDDVMREREFEKMESALKQPAEENIVENSLHSENLWVLTASGNCKGFKTNCVQETKIRRISDDASGNLSAEEITPPEIKELSRIEKERAALEAGNSIFAQTPGGTTRISLNRGFDKCTAATVAQMQTWWNSSPFYDANIYFSGRNRGCSQPQLTAAWVNQVSAQGWGLIPTVVGYQSPCSVCTNCQKHSSDPVVAEQQGRGEADIAITDANNLGLTQGTVLYYDMERYDDTSGTGACSTPTKAFLKGWTDRLHELGYISGVYGSPTNAVGDWLNIPAASRMDAVWLARWDNIPSVWFYAAPSPAVPESAWGNHQRIKQWQAPHNETWGGVTFNIDGNIADGPVAGVAIAKNKRADFDGDGKSDISVFRPETGVWYVLNSSNFTYSILNFGISTDIVAPGDFDGDGKTDFAVWRPSNGTWHVYSRSIYRSFAFGSQGDIPVPADYDGDGRTDAAVFRPSTGVWYIWNSFNSRGNSYTIVQFGLNGDRPVVGDYDGDGRADIAVWRPSDGVWHLLQSTNGYAAAQFGISTDKAVQADYDGDGKTDLGIYRDGVWYLFQSQAGVLVTQWGLPDDKPSVGDYDGDGKHDVTVFRPGTGYWYIRQTQAGVWITPFGISTDSLVPAAYTPQP